MSQESDSRRDLDRKVVLSGVTTYALHPGLAEELWRREGSSTG